MKPIIAALLINHAPVEVPIISKVANEYRLTDEQTALLVTIRLIENGRSGCEFGIELPKAMRFKGKFEKSLRLQAKYAAGTIKKRYAGDLEEFAKIYCPVNWESWVKMANYFMRKAKHENARQARI